MALYEIEATLLVDIDDETWPSHQEAVVTDGLNELFRGTNGWVLDWAYAMDPKNHAERLVKRRDDLDPDAYEEGEFIG